MEQTNTQPEIKLYSKNQISFACFIGGPLAAGILFRRNFINLNEEGKAKNAIVIGIMTTALIMLGLYYTPDNVVDRMPTFILPAIYTGIAMFLTDKYFSDVLLAHKKTDGAFYGYGRVIGWSLLGLGLIFLFLFSIVYTEESEMNPQLQGKLEMYYQNEDEALKLFEMLGTAEKQEIVRFIDMRGLPLWYTNHKILEEAIKSPDLTKSEIAYLNKLIEYNNLRTESFKLMMKSIQEDTTAYDAQITAIFDQIEVVLGELSSETSGN